MFTQFVVAALALAGASNALAPPSHLSRAAANLQTQLQLDPSQVQPNLAQDGQAVAEAGQVPSLTSKNNFINFCETQKTTLTNGLQTTAGSCNPTIMGRIIASANLPSAKFSFPPNGAVIAANQTFTITLNVAHMDTGNFVNANTNFFAAPGQVNAAGDPIAHNHVVVEAISSLTQTTTTTPTKFAFFKGMNAPAVGGALTADVTGGLSPGVYRLSSIGTFANHQPFLGSIAQHGTMDDIVYFTASNDAALIGTNSFTGAAASGGKGAAAAAGGAAGAGKGSASVSVSSAAVTTTAVAAAGAGKGGKGGKGGAAAVSTSVSVSVAASSVAPPAATTSAAAGKGGKGSAGKGSAGKGGAAAVASSVSVPAVASTSKAAVAAATTTTSAAASAGKGGKGGKANPPNAPAAPPASGAKSNPPNAPAAPPAGSAANAAAGAGAAGAKGAQAAQAAQKPQTPQTPQTPQKPQAPQQPQQAQQQQQAQHHQ